MAARREKYDYLFKFIIIGDTNSGKSCCLHQFIEQKFRKGPPKHTIGVEFGSRIVQVGGYNIKLQIWDTAGQERFRSVTRSYYRNAVGALVVYDITNRETFDHLVSWLADARTLARSEVSIVTCGNKSDLKESRQVSYLEASRFAQENEVMFMETSALTGEGIEEVFLRATRSILTKIEDGTIDPKTMAAKDRPLPDDGEEGGGGSGGCWC
eukprot:PLAT14390.1.p1 GENE.PLAT14390.1~~PLAT14390.1.p1  ORF type:complete len:232 (-),score=56.90 PLAT14390.1:150-782(-)